jgi:hypothetical protein
VGHVPALLANVYGLRHRCEAFHRCRIACFAMGGSGWDSGVPLRRREPIRDSTKNGINQYLSRLVALRALFESSSGEVSRRQFEIFAEEILRDQTAIQSVSWIQRVPHAERAARERAAIDDGIPGYQIKAVVFIYSSPGGSSQIGGHLEIQLDGQPALLAAFGMDKRLTRHGDRFCQL